MVSSCSAIGCRSRATKNQKCTFHRFPSRPELLEKWVRAVKRKNFTPSKSAKLCEKHFTPDSYVVNYSARRVLKQDAVPSIFDFSSFISDTNTYKRGVSELTTTNTSTVKDSSPITSIQFVDVESLKCHAIPYTSNQTVIIIETNNQVGSPDGESTNDTLSHEDPNSTIPTTTKSIDSISLPSTSPEPASSISLPSTSPKPTNSISLPSTSLKPNSSISLPSASAKPTCSPSIPSTSGASTSSSHQNYTLGTIKDTYSSLNSPHDWRRQQFIIKAQQMKDKYQERLKVMNHVHQQHRKRKAFLENLLIRIKEKQLTSDDDTVDLIDCFVEEESYDSDEESSEDESTEVEDNIFGMIDDKISKASNLGKNSQADDCQMFGAYVESILNVMPKENATVAKNRIAELVNAYKGKKLIRMSKKFDDAFSGLENIEINEN